MTDVACVDVVSEDSERGRWNQPGILDSPVDGEASGTVEVVMCHTVGVVDHTDTMVRLWSVHMY